MENIIYDSKKGFINKIIYCCIFVIVAFLINCSGGDNVDNEIIRPVRYQIVQDYSSEQSRTFSGVSKAGIETKLSFKVGGTIDRLEVKVGDKVAKGKLLASVTNTDFALQYEQAKVAYKNAKVQRKTAKSNYKRIAQLYENQNISLSEYERAKTNYETAKAEVKSREKSLQLIGSQIGYTRLNAPINGIISKVNAEQNENVGAGQIVIEINSDEDVDPEVVVGLPESYISRVKNGDKVDIIFSSLKNGKFTGIITEISFAIDAASSTYPITIQLENAPADIRPGMTADVKFTFVADDEKESIVVPAIAVCEDKNNRFVYIVKSVNGDTAIVHKKIVETGDFGPEGIEITKGLEDGDLVVTAGISKLSEGMKVLMLK